VCVYIYMCVCVCVYVCMCVYNDGLVEVDNNLFIVKTININNNKQHLLKINKQYLINKQTISYYE